MIEVIYGLPASGKSRALKEKVVRLVGNGRKVLWLTSLRAERNRSAYEFSARLEPDLVKILFSKEELCDRVRALPSRSPLVGFAACMTCERESCPYKDTVRAAIKMDYGLFVGTHSFAFLAPFFDIVVIDEFEDALITCMRSYTAEEIEKELSAIRRVFGESVANEVRRKYVIEVGNGVYMIKHQAFLHRFLQRGLLYGLSATMPPASSDLFAFLLGFENIEELIEFEEEGLAYVVTSVLPPPPRDDYFVINEMRCYTYDTTLFAYRRRALRMAMGLVREGKTVTVVARSKSEASWFYKEFSKAGIKPLCEGINWSLANFGAWKMYPLRILVVAGKFYRSLDIESDVVVAFYQHRHPLMLDKVMSRYAVFVEAWNEFARFEEYRVHVQTIYRCAREWYKRHDFVLMDQKYAEAIAYFPHIYAAVRERISFARLV